MSLSMRYLILVIFSWFLECSAKIQDEKVGHFPIDISIYHAELVKASKHPFWGGPIKVFESGETVVFQITGSKDLFVLNSKTKNLLKYYPNPPDTIGGGVFRYNPVSLIYPVNSGFRYLQNNSRLISFEVPQMNFVINSMDEDLPENPSKILYASDEMIVSHWWGSSSDIRSQSGGVYLTDLKSSSTKKIISANDLEDFAGIISSEDKILVLGKYKPVIKVFDFDGLQLETLSIPKSKFLKYEKYEKPNDYLNLSPEEKVKFLEDYCLDFIQKGDTLAFLHLVYSARKDRLQEDYVLSVLTHGKLLEKKLDLKPLNFNLKGELYLVDESDSLKYLVKRSLNSMF